MTSTSLEQYYMFYQFTLQKMPGVIDFVDWKDIPAENNVQLFSWMVDTAPKKELFATTKITHVGQVVGMICADTPEQARRAAK